MASKFYIVLILLAALSGDLWAQQVAPRIAGLGSNKEYMALLEQEKTMQIREDSLVVAVRTMRQKFQENPANRQLYSKDILSLEEQIFSMRMAKGRLIDRINTIEQEWVMNNLGAAEAVGKSSTPGHLTPIPDSLKRRNLTSNHYFREQLSAADYAALQQAQQREMAAVDKINRYFENYGQIARLAQEYAAASVEQEAVAIYEKQGALQGCNEVLADSLQQTWNYIFDNKSYAYGYLLDKLGKEAVLSHESQMLAEANRQLAALQGQTASEAVADYFLRKQVLIDYEIAVAETLHFTEARDSLRGVEVQLKTIDFKLPKIEFQERYFINYEPVTFPVKLTYSSVHPIPEIINYAHGTIYRILLGTFTSKRAVSTFRGATPLCYQRDDQGRWCYFAGDLATKSEAEEAQKQLKERGFARPEIVVWTDGQERNLSREPELGAVLYRVEIIGAQTLSDAVKQLITETAEGRELSRVGQQLFVIGHFEDKVLAEKVAAAVAQADASLEIKVVEIAQDPK